MGLPDNTVPLKLPNLERHSERAKVGTEDRLQLPKAMITSMTWWHQKKGHVGAELVEDGLFRILGIAQLAEALDKLHAQRLEDDAAEHERRMAIRDKYRKLAITKDARLQLTVDLLTFMGLSAMKEAQDQTVDVEEFFPEDRFLYVQATRNTLEVMTAEYRRKRRKLFRDVSVNLHIDAD